MTNHPNRSKQQPTHTPGPWCIDTNESLSLAVIEDNENGLGICTIDGMGRTPKMLADARLIAAAPELLAALKLVRDEYCEGGMLDGTPAEKAIVAAIAKAEDR